jgi:hypothetical protein
VHRLTSKDGTSIAYQRAGAGPAVVLVGGAIDDGSENAPLASELAVWFTVYNHARRGRGDSGDTLPYAVDREIEDLEALVAAAGGSAHLYGASSGGALALEATAAGVAVDRLAVYDVPYNLAEDGPHWHRGDGEKATALLAEGRRGDVVELFMRTVGSSTARLATITRPVLVVTGGRSQDAHAGGLPPDFFERAADAVAASVPQARRRTLAGQGHVADPKVVAPLLERFFGA